MFSEYYILAAFIVWVVLGAAGYLAIAINHPFGIFLRGSLFVIWLAFCVFIVGLRQPWLGTDTQTYTIIIDSIVAGTDEIARLDSGFYWTVRLASGFTSTPGILLVFQIIFVIFFALAIRRFGNRNWPLLLFFYFGCFFYHNASINVMRTGVALAILMAGMSLTLVRTTPSPTRYAFIAAGGALLALLSAFFHYFNALFFLVAAIGFFLPRTRIAAGIWFLTVCFIGAGLHPELIFQRYIAGPDTMAEEKALQYIEGTAAGVYQSGFRWDFLVFMTMFALFPVYYRWFRKYRSDVYLRLTNTYFLSSALFVGAFYIPYSDRVGMFCFFLMPLMACYPLLDSNYARFQQDRWIGFVSATFLGIASFLYLPYTLSLFKN